MQDMVRSRLRNRKRKFGRIIALLIVMFGGFYTILGILWTFSWKSAHASHLTSPVINESQHVLSASASNPPGNPHVTAATGLQTVVQNALSGTTGTYGVVIRNLKTGEEYDFNAEKTFQSASLYKLWVMAVTYHQMQLGQIHGTDKMSQSVVTLNKEFQIGQDVAEKKEGNITMTVDDALYQMITISDNYAALLLTEKVHLSSLAAFLSTYGLSQSKVGSSNTQPTTSPRDVALFFQMLYNGQLANQTYTAKMISLLKQQKLNEKIPLYVPDDVIIAHKTGELDSFSHDAGIVYTPAGDYIIVVMTNSDNPAQANERIADVSEAVYNYFLGLPTLQDNQ